MNIKELADLIEKKAKVNVFALPIGKRFITRSPDGKMVVFEMEKPWPVANDGSTILAIFQGDSDVRVYTLFLGDPPKEGAPPPPPPARHTISKHQPAIFSEIMAIETFINEVADEWVQLDEGVSTAERERASVLEFLQANLTKSGYELATRIQNGEHLTDNDDEEDDDEPEGVVTSAPNVPAS